MNRVALIIATKDRPAELCSLLRNLEGQSYKPAEIIVVDSSQTASLNEDLGLTRIPIKYHRFHPPSAARQRNAGLNDVSSGINLIGFLDDDVILKPNTLEIMMKFWNDAPLDVVGAGFNLINHPPLVASKLKSLPLIEAWGLYSPKPGLVLRSGFQTMVGTVNRMTEVRWLSSGYSLWRRSVFNTVRFDEWFAASSYLEDLDFSYSAGRGRRLVVIPNALIFHNHASGGRESGRVFGKREVVNRLYFVSKHPELSTFWSMIALLIRMMMSIALFMGTGNVHYLRRCAGNVTGFVNYALKGRSLFMIK